MREKLEIISFTIFIPCAIIHVCFVIVWTCKIYLGNLRLGDCTNERRKREKDPLRFLMWSFADHRIAPSTLYIYTAVVTCRHIQWNLWKKYYFLPVSKRASTFPFSTVTDAASWLLRFKENVIDGLMRKNESDPLVLSRRNGFIWI